jgi:hypothetical protein
VSHDTLRSPANTRRVLEIRPAHIIPACTAKHYSSADPGTARSAAWKPTFEWLPSQKGFFVDAPQRQGATVSFAG